VKTRNPNFKGSWGRIFWGVFKPFIFFGAVETQEKSGKGKDFHTIFRPLLSPPSKRGFSNVQTPWCSLASSFLFLLIGKIPLNRSLLSHSKNSPLFVFPVTPKNPLSLKWSSKKSPLVKKKWSFQNFLCPLIPGSFSTKSLSPQNPFTLLRCLSFFRQ